MRHGFLRQALWFPIRLLQVVYLATWSAFWISAALVVRLLVRETTTPLNMARRIWAPGLLWSVPWLGPLTIEVSGLENIDFSKPHLFASNHQSILDIAVLFRVLPTPLVFVLKEELRKVPFLGWYVSAMGMIFVRRGERKRSLEALRQGEEQIQAGKSVLAFPEGTRSRDGRIGPFKAGVFLPALDAGIPIVPVAIEGTGACLPAGGFDPKPGLIRVAIGRPIDTANLDRSDRRILSTQAREAVTALHQDLVRSPEIDPQPVVAKA